ncbi:hypothetical protein BH23CHL2_BH23CHL2_34600 [soil metagenome]
MAVMTSRISAAGTAISPGQAMRRVSQALFAFLQTGAPSHDTDTVTSRQVSISDLRGEDVALALSLRNGYFALPADLKLVQDRLNRSPTIRAAGFADSRSRSVGVDVANWSRPCAPELDEIAWRRVFIWIVGTDNNLTNVSILEPPAERNDRMVGSYGYNANGVPGYGVLQVAAAPDGSWEICDCWGDATEADRVDELTRMAASR